ncbi:hypothetical protein ON010_g17731 [Phytophthora cinnamomi]|nr:hypothetical protein ON010_g17731 [Phytophthora cinnamomi]
MVFGNLRWRTPACLVGRATFASDVHSLAMCMIEAATNGLRLAHLDDNCVREIVQNGVIPSRPDSMTDDAWVFVVSLTQFSPEKRVGLKSMMKNLKLFAERESAIELIVAAHVLRQSKPNGAFARNARPAHSR